MGSVNVQDIVLLPPQIAASKWASEKKVRNDSGAKALSDVYIGLNAACGETDKVREFVRRTQSRIQDDADLFDHYRARRRSKYTARDAMLSARHATHSKLCLSAGILGKPEPLRAGSDGQRTWFAYKPRRYMRKVAESDTCYMTDDDGIMEPVRGVVYQLPSRRGNLRFLAGYQYVPDIQDGALFSDTIFEGKPSDRNDTDPKYSDAFVDAMNTASLMAERVAETERAYHHNYNLGRKAAMIARDEMRPIRQMISATIREIAKAWRNRHDCPDVSLASMFDEIECAAEEYEDARNRWEDTRSDVFNASAFHDGYRDEF